MSSHPKTNLEIIKHAIHDLNSRLHWDEYFMSIGLLISSRSPSTRLKVGAVIVKDNRIISSGYNGYPSGCQHISIVRDNHEQNTIHAEQNAISDAARRGTAVEGATIYITHFPCINCCKYIISAGIKEIRYLDDYKNDELVPLLCGESGVVLKKID
jgi:dCMP deaminase